MEPNDQLAKIIEARMKLQRRFGERMLASPSVAGARPLGTGATNRHGMPKIPIGQTATTKWPVPNLGYQPNIPLDKWRLRVDGEVENPLLLMWADFMALPQTEDTSDFHCVTTWSKMDMAWRGVRLVDLAALAQLKETATHLMCYGYDTYTTNPVAGGGPQARCAAGPYRGRRTPFPGAWRPSAHDHASIVCLEGIQMDQTAGVFAPK